MSSSSDYVELDPEYKKSFEVTELALSILGLKIFYPKGNLGIFRRIKQEFLFVISFLQLSFTVLGEIIYLSHSLGEDFFTVTDLMTCITFCIIGMSKMVVICLNRSALQKQFEDLNPLWPRDETKPYVEEIKTRSLKRLRLISAILFTMYNVIITIYNFDPLVHMAFDIFVRKTKCQKVPPYLVWVPFDLTQLGIYEVAFLYLSWSGYVSAMGIVAQDCLFQVACSHLSMMFEIMQYDIMNVVPDDYMYNSENTDEKVVIKRLKNILENHQKLISLADVLEESFNVVLMINVLISSVTICCEGFQSTIADAKQMIKYAYSGAAMVVQTWIFSWYANLLIEKSSGLMDACYHCRWYDTGPKFRRLLLILMMRAKKPIHVTAMKFSTVSLHTFTSIAGKSWSYFTLLTTVYEPPEK